MNKVLAILVALLSLCSCKEKYEMPNLFKHHEKGNVKQITIKSYFVINGALDPTDNMIVIWGEPNNGILTYDNSGKITSDGACKYVYDDTGKLTCIEGQGGQISVNYNELNEIEQLGTTKLRYNSNNQICAVEEIRPAIGYLPASKREYEYNDKGQMTLCKIDGGHEVFGYEYDSKGDLSKHIYLQPGGRVTEYYVSITKRDNNGNWTERRIKDSNNHDYLQTREIRYY